MTELNPTQQQKQYKILLIGDNCTDVYQYGTVDRISPEAPVPVFVPKYDIMKIQDLSKDIKKSQKIHVQSPRFIKTLERALTAILDEADSAKTGELGYNEFYNAFKKLENYNLCENDLRTLLSLADENPNGKITWREFIPFGINAV